MIFQYMATCIINPVEYHLLLKAKLQNTFSKIKRTFRISKNGQIINIGRNLRVNALGPLSPLHFKPIPHFLVCEQDGARQPIELLCS